jgi:hypothetical protein
MKKYFCLIFVLVFGLFLSGCANSVVTNNVPNNLSVDTKKSADKNLQESTTTFQIKTDFLSKYNLYYFDGDGNFVKNGEKIDVGGNKYAPDILCSDGAILSSYSEAVSNAGKKGVLEDVTKNDYKLYFQGRAYENYNGMVFRDKDLLFYVKCIKVEYRQKDNGNRCITTALYSNNDKIDESNLVSDVFISVGHSDIEPLFVKNGILYYGKTVDKIYSFYSYNPTSKKISLYKPELFSNNENEPLGILDDGSVVFDNVNDENATGIFKNNIQSKFFDIPGDGFFPDRGECIGNSYYFLYKKTQSLSNDYELFKDGLLIARINSNEGGKIIDPEKQDCHFGTTISTYATPAYCINKAGTIVRMDMKAPAYNIYDHAIYIINDDIVNFSPYWIKDGLNGKNELDINSVSFIFDEKGNVSYLVVDSRNETFTSSIYLVPYLGGGTIGKPQILVSDASLFGVSKK